MTISGMKDTKRAILVVSFGTSYIDSCDRTIGAIEKAIAGTFPEYEVRRTFTSQFIINKLKMRDGLDIDNVKEALARAVRDHIQILIVQPTYLMDGYEYTELVGVLKKYENKFDQMVLGTPLLTDDRDFECVIRTITEATAVYDDGHTAICLMGHGTGADANCVYTLLQEKLESAGFENYYIGTVEADPSLEHVIGRVNDKGLYKKIILQPLMVVAGDHASKDMAGDGEDSWRSRFESEGYKVKCIFRGLGEFEKIQNLYIAHIYTSVDSLVK